MRISDGSSDVCSSDLHQPRKRGAVRVEVILLYAPRLHPVAVQKIGDEPAHALVDLREDIGLGRIERVVEVEYPRIDMVERKRGGSGWHGGRPSACAARRQSRIYLAGVNQRSEEQTSELQ